MATLESRVKAMESDTRQSRSVYEYSDDELHNYLLPFFGGALPTTEQLTEFLGNQTAIAQEKKNAKS